MSAAETTEARAARAADEPDFSEGVALVEGAYVPIAEARLSLLDWGFVRSDVTYDVAHVWKGSFFRLEDHLARFERSVAGLRMTLPLGRAEVRASLIECVRLSGLREAYVEMICTRGRPAPGAPRHPKYAQNRFFAFAIPFVWITAPEQQERGLRVIVAETPRIPPECLDPLIKNFHWGDMTRALFEADEKGADQPILLDMQGNVAEGPGFNVFAVIEGTVVTPPCGALQGITRRTVLELCRELAIPAETRNFGADELREADEAFLTSTAGGVMPVARIDERIMSNDRPGPISARLRERYWAKHDDPAWATAVYG